ncbi:hypothetical protein [Streptomyces graminofaciens]|nr:hypothetical protein [Streptomyces graminofaciens]
MAHKPVEWTLVVPCTLTTSERAFVNKLADGKAVKVSMLDRSDLDCHFAAHSDLEASFTRDLLREAAKDFNQEKAMLLGADDLVIVTTVIHQDGCWAQLHNDAYFARSACADFAYDQGLDELR